MSSRSILGLAAEGLGDLLRGSKTTAKYAWKGGALAVNNPLTRAHPFRYSVGATTLLGATAAAGLGGIGPMSSIGDKYSKDLIAEYGDRPDTHKTITATQASGTIAAGVLGVVGGLGLIGRGPIGIDYMKAGKELMSAGKASPGLWQSVEGVVGSAAGKIADLSENTFKMPIEMLARPRGLLAYGRGLVSSKSPEELMRIRRQELRAKTPGRGAAKRAQVAKGMQPMEDDMPFYQAGQATRQSVGKLGQSIGESFKKFNPIDTITSKDRSYMKHPIMFGMAFGAAGGLGTGLAVGGPNQKGAPEGNIQGISSSPQGGISPELQFSTQNLMFALHRNNKSARMRYQ